MKKDTFYALTKSGSGRVLFRKVEGSLLKLGLFSCGIYQGYKTVDGQPRKSWYIVELTSGLAIASGDTKKETLEYGRRKVKTIPSADILRIIERNINEYGQSPLYQEGLDLDEEKAK